ncbi:DUF397 domain-containing protein [Streptomyces sp. NPDC003077]|uniref:DUF397 domain-containing protein n=1 Tax=Streptomyces sp. NPDC003077 TaxID=3154443 RepID=UPI0033A2B107
MYWQKSSYSTDAEEAACVEICAVDGAVHVREGDVPEAQLRLGSAAIAAFLRATKADRFVR